MPHKINSNPAYARWFNLSYQIGQVSAEEGWNTLLMVVFFLHGVCVSRSAASFNKLLPITPVLHASKVCKVSFAKQYFQFATSEPSFREKIAQRITIRLSFGSD